MNSKSNEEFKQQFSEAQEKLKSKTMECVRLNLTIEVLHQHLARVEEQLYDQNERSRRSRQVLTHLDQEIKQTNQENAKLVSDLNKLDKSNEELKQQFSEAQEKLTSKTSECMGLNFKIEELQQCLEIAEQHLLSQNETSKQSQQALTQLQQERDEFAVQVKQTKKENADRIYGLQSLLEKFIKSNKELKQQFSEAQEKLTSKISSLTDEQGQIMSRLDTTITELQRKSENDDNKSAVAEAAHKTKEELHKVLEESPTKDDTLMSSADERTTEKPRRCITNILTEKLETIEIKGKSDEEDCAIWGMAVTNTGTILLADYYNSNIKSVSKYNISLSALPLPEVPKAITVLHTGLAVVATLNKKLYLVSIHNNYLHLYMNYETQLEYYIGAMVSYNGYIVVTCYTEPITIKLINIQGQELWSVAVDHIGRELFADPHGITITTIKGSDVVIVSDNRKNTLTVLEAETGRYISTIDIYRGVRRPGGITVDKYGNVYVCYTGEIVVWSNDFKKSKILLSGDKLGGDPFRIVYNAVDGSLYVSYSHLSDSRNTVDRFRLV